MPHPILTALARLALPAALGLGLLTPAAAVPDAAVPPGLSAAGRQFLLVDPAGDGRAVEVVGDLDRADRVAVLVPGVATRLADFDRGLGGVARRAPAVQARALLAEARAVEPGARVAVVAWLGYDPPEGIGLAAARVGRAAEGADALADFVAALGAGRPSATVTVVGHSYGAVVVGLAAARLGPAVTDLVAIGAPGMGVRDSAALRTRARVWAGQADTDWIRRVPAVRVGVGDFSIGLGRRPSDPAFGARPLPVTGVRGHDGYLEPGSAALRAIALIALGRQPGGSDSGVRP